MESTPVNELVDRYFAMQQWLPIAKSILLAVVIFILGWMVSKFISRLALRGLRKRSVDEALSRFLSQLALYTVLGATFIAALGAVGVQTTSLVAVFASAGLAVGLALQGSLGNFASGVMILFFRPFTLGEVVTTGGHTGKVEDIGIFATTLLTPDNEKIIIPNAKVTGDSIVNLTTIGVRRGCIDVGVAYGTDVAKVQEILVKAAQSADRVLADPAPSAVFFSLGASALEFKLYAFADAPDWWPMLHDVRKAVYDQLNAAGIEIPFNQIVVHQGPGAATGR